MHGNYGIPDDNYKFIKNFQARSHHHLSVHEFLVLDGKTILIESPIITIHDLQPYNGEKEQDWILAGSFQGEISIVSHFFLSLISSHLQKLTLRPEEFFSNGTVLNTLILPVNERILGKAKQTPTNLLVDSALP